MSSLKLIKKQRNGKHNISTSFHVVGKNVLSYFGSQAKVNLDL